LEDVVDAPISEMANLITRASIKPGYEDAAKRVLAKLVDDVRTHEPDTLTYVVHTPSSGNQRLQSLPHTHTRQAVIFGPCRNGEAFVRHTNGPSFARFLAEYGQLFASAEDSPFSNFECLSIDDGFNRLTTAEDKGGIPFPASQNRHPGVMFEIIANHQSTLKDFYSQVFDWYYQIGTGDFAYVHFDGHSPPLLGGIGQANPSVPGFEPGHNSYLLVDNLEATIRRAEKAGGKAYMAPAQVDGYHFAMIQDPEANPIGLIEPFRG
jgi:uncharacterized protein